VSDSNAAAAAPGTPKAQAGEPRPEPIRFFGTTWVDHGAGYRGRRVAASAGSLLCAALGALALRYGFQGLARIGGFVTILAVGGFAISSALAFRRTWIGFSQYRPTGTGTGPAAEAGNSTSSVYAIGFVGSLLAYFLRSLTEAPGEGLRRAEYEEARAAHARRRTARSGNPANRG
jgi:hypothetical protein